MDKLNDMRIEDIQKAVNVARIFYDILAATINEVVLKTAGAKEISKNDVLNVMYTYNLDCQNFPDEQESIFEHAVKFISQKTNLSESTVEKIFNQVGEDSRILNVPSVNVNLVTRYDSSNNMVRLNVGEIGVWLPSAVYARLFRSVSGDTTKIAELVLKYFPLGITSGMFWSVDRPIYKDLIENSPLPVLECFASPFNYSNSNYCSLFKSDCAFGSKGNFFEYIKKLNVPCRLLVNPPYTESVIDKAVNAVIEYLTRVNGSEAVFMLPVWNKVGYGGKSLAIEHLEQQPNIKQFEVQSRQHTVYSFTRGESITANMDLMFYIISSPEHEPHITIERLKQLVNESFRRVGSQEYLSRPVAAIQKKSLPIISTSSSL